jgi:hypothetical protein
MTRDILMNAGDYADGNTDLAGGIISGLEAAVDHPEFARQILLELRKDPKNPQCNLLDTLIMLQAFWGDEDNEGEKS